MEQFFPCSAIVASTVRMIYLVLLFFPQTNRKYKTHPVFQENSVQLATAPRAKWKTARQGILNTTNSLSACNDGVSQWFGLPFSGPQRDVHAAGVQAGCLFLTALTEREREAGQEHIGAEACQRSKAVLEPRGGSAHFTPPPCGQHQEMMARLIRTTDGNHVCVTQNRHAQSERWKDRNSQYLTRKVPDTCTQSV